MRNDKPLKTRVLISSIILMFMVLCDIYMITSVPQNYQLLAIAAFVTFLWMTFTLDGWINLREMGIQEREEQYQDLLKAEKASYLIFQQKFQDLDHKLNFIGQKIMSLEKANSAGQKTIASMLESLREDQKKIAKLTVSRTKENADALISSNGQLLSQMDNILQTMGNTGGLDTLGQGDNIQQEILSRLQEISRLLGGGAQLPSQGSGMALPAGQKPVSEGAGESLSSGELEALLSDIETPGAQPLESQEEADGGFQSLSSSAANLLQEVQDTEAEESKSLFPAQTPPSQEALGTEAEESQPPLSSAAGSEPEGTKSVPGETQEEPVNAEGQEGQLPKEPILAAEPEVPAPAVPPEESSGLAGSAANPKVPAQAPKPTAQPQAPAKPNTADPNRMMSPEDIAALIANTAVEELPDTTPKIEEEKPPKPDVSDPNKMMSPEDIAALIANM